MWTLALGKPGHRLALDLDAGFVETFDAWLESLRAKPAARNRRVTSKK